MSDKTSEASSPGGSGRSDATDAGCAGIRAPFRVGERVTWRSQAAGTWRVKEGEVVEVVPPHRDPKIRIAGSGFSRPHESYIVKAIAIGRRSTRHTYYWPRASLLTRAVAVQPAAVAPDATAPHAAEASEAKDADSCRASRLTERAP